MKIIEKDRGEFQFKELNQGETFKYNGFYFIKCSSALDEEEIAVEIGSGEAWCADAFINGQIEKVKLEAKEI